MITPDSTQLAKAKFLSEWEKIYPESPPISQFFKFRLPNRWGRIHSLPESKRYPDTKPEWDVLLDRQNRVIDSLIPQQATIRIVINYIAIDCYLFKSFDLENIGVFVDEEGEAVYQLFTFQTTWEHATLNPLLVLIAQEDLRAFIIAPDCLIAPYDGGMDVILKDAHTCWEFKRTFKDWLSKRSDGL
jgi:hypothetical protein